MRKFFLLLFIVTLYNTSFAQKEIKVLWLGNSYISVNNLPELVNELSAGTDKMVTSESVCPGGCTLFQHARSAVSLNAIRKGDWDYVVLQEQSQLPSIDYYRHNAMQPAYQALYDTIMIYNPDAIVVGYMTWGRQYGGQQCENYGQGLYCSADFVDFNHMQDTMSVAYCENAYATDSYVAPVGDAWKESLSLYPEIVLHGPDESHPTYEGSYLAACVFYAVFWKETPIGTYHNNQIGDKTANLMQRVASEVVFSNLEKWNIDMDVDVMDERAEINNFNIVNNPENDSVIIRNINHIAATVRVIDVNGLIVEERDIINDETIVINNSKGIYIIQIIEKENQNRYTEKIMKL